MDQYLPGLAKLWQSPDGKQYGLPKDWDTVALIVNQDMLGKAGVTKQQLDSATWNPTDGGSFQQIDRQAHGRHGGQARRRAGLRSEKRQDLRPRLRPGRPDLRADDLGRLRRQPRLQAARQEPVGHEVPLRRPGVRADVHVVAEHDPQGLHALARAGPHARPVGGVPERPCRAGDRRRLDDRHLLGDQGHQGRLLAAAEGPGGLVEHVQRARGRDLGRLQAQARGAQVGQLPRLAGVPEHRRHRGRRVPGDQVGGPEGRRRRTRRTGSTSARSRPTSTRATRCSTRSPTRRRRST